jgi:hypothetical protein
MANNVYPVEADSERLSHDHHKRKGESEFSVLALSHKANQQDAGYAHNGFGDDIK